MDSDRVRGLLNAYIDGELDLVTSLDIEEHLKGCAACSRQLQTLVDLHAATSDRSLRYAAPAGLEKRIRASLRETAPSAPPRLAFSWRWFTPAVALVAAMFVLGFFARGWLAPNPQTALAQQVQMAHVRSLMADHLVDVVSSDQHTVKPWFDGKLPFAPPVPDLAPQGFPLAGGRLDYLDGEPVAALVYQRGKHLINLFIWPSAEKPQGLQNTTYNGYHIYHWDQSGMTFWAVSDVNPADLLAFTEAFQKGVP